MLRGVYRSLIATGRTYAAFERDQLTCLINRLNCGRIEILDPMAGYGSLMKYCSEIGVPSVSVEYNPASYFWIILTNPKNSSMFSKIISTIIKKRPNWPHEKFRAEVSKDWYPCRSLELLRNLLRLVQKSAKENTNENVDTYSMSLLLPFVGRLSSNVPGNIVTHVKKGGICVYTGWENEFLIYLQAISERIEQIRREAKNLCHEVQYGDLRNIALASKYSAVITSPPYPNSRDYCKMFAPENYFINLMANEKRIYWANMNAPLIGSATVSGMKKNSPDDFSNLSSKSAKKFLHSIATFRGSKQARYDNKVYYVPYFGYYFLELEKAYTNLAKYLDKNFTGYFIVINNTARDQIVPVAQAIIEIWTELGFKANVEDDLTRELFHFGSINPRVKGFKAKHTEYTIKVSK